MEAAGLENQRQHVGTASGTVGKEGMHVLNGRRHTTGLVFFVFREYITSNSLPNTKFLFFYPAKMPIKAINSMEGGWRTRVTCW